MAKCTDCKHCIFYTTGGDEYPAFTSLAYCDQEHWENGDQHSGLDDEINCIDFEQNNKQS